ncbi:MAG: fumarylacetoacetate hydrolase family protein [Rhodocyclaceae bacterium]
MNTEQLRAAAERLAQARRGGAAVADVPADQRPQDASQAETIQRLVVEQLGERIGGWKCVLPLPDHVAYAPIHGSTIFAVSPVKAWAPGDTARIEPELACVMSHDLPPRNAPYTPDEVDAAIGSVHLALELVGNRYVDAAGHSFLEMMGDCLNNHGLFIGPKVDVGADKARAQIPLSVESAGAALREFSGHHPNKHSRVGVYWLAEYLRARGEGLRAGQAVITGSYAGVIDIPVGVPVRVRYGGLGALEITVSR